VSSSSSSSSSSNSTQLNSMAVRTLLVSSNKKDVDAKQQVGSLVSTPFDLGNRQTI
jgi:hypothetical protein